MTLYLYNLVACSCKVGQKFSSDLLCARGYTSRTAPIFAARPPVSTLDARLARSLKHILAILQVEDWGCHLPACSRVRQHLLCQLEHPWYFLWPYPLPIHNLSRESQIIQITRTTSQILRHFLLHEVAVMATPKLWQSIITPSTRTT